LSKRTKLLVQSNTWEDKEHTLLQGKKLKVLKSIPMENLRYNKDEYRAEMKHIPSKYPKVLKVGHTSAVQPVTLKFHPFYSPPSL
jgi:predicted transcriptional regulator